MTPSGGHPGQSDIDGVLLAADSIGRDGEAQGYHELVLTLDEETIDVRLVGDRKDKILMVPLAKLEEALRPLKRAQAAKRRARAAA